MAGRPRLRAAQRSSWPKSPPRQICLAPHLKSAFFAALSFASPPATSCHYSSNSSANSPDPNAMLTFNGSLKVYVALEPCDMRKSFNTLAELVRNHLQLDPLSGAAFLFTNKSRRLIKILYFDGTGYWVVAKRLEKGTFSWPADIQGDRRKLILKPTALAMLTDGIDLRDGAQRAWYEVR